MKNDLFHCDSLIISWTHFPFPLRHFNHYSFPALDSSLSTESFSLIKAKRRWSGETNTFVFQKWRDSNLLYVFADLLGSQCSIMGELRNCFNTHLEMYNWKLQSWWVKSRSHSGKWEKEKEKEKVDSVPMKRVAKCTKS